MQPTRRHLRAVREDERPLPGQLSSHDKEVLARWVADLYDKGAIIQNFLYFTEAYCAAQALAAKTGKRFQVKGYLGEIHHWKVFEKGTI